jgi:hypothetical protein
LQFFRWQSSDVAEDALDDLFWVFEEGHEVGHAFRDGSLLVLFVAFEQFGNSALD